MPMDASPYDDPLELVEDLIEDVEGTELSSPGWSIFKGEYLEDLKELRELLQERDDDAEC